MTCYFVMPFRKKAMIRFLNSTKQRVKVQVAVKVAPWKWDDRSLNFRARWRTDNDLDLDISNKTANVLASAFTGVFQ